MGESFSKIGAKGSKQQSVSIPPPATPPPLRALLRHRGYWQWSITTQLVGLPPLMASLGLVLAGTYATGNVAVGGLMVTVYVIALTFCVPLTGRLLDRIGPATGTPYLLGFATLALSGLAAAVVLKASAPPLLLLAGLAGVFAARSSSAMRSVLNQVVPPRLLTPALSINSIAVELTVVNGPLIVALAAIPAPPGAIIAMVAITAIGAFSVRRLREILSVTDAAQTNSLRAVYGATVALYFGCS